jgi:hypothetical protein
MQRIVCDHANTWLDLDLSVRWTGWPPSTGLPTSARGIYELLYEYPNVGDYKGRTGPSPPTSYPSTVEHRHFWRFLYTEEPPSCIRKLPVSPRDSDPTLWQVDGLFSVSLIYALTGHTLLTCFPLYSCVCLAKHWSSKYMWNYVSSNDIYV